MKVFCDNHECKYLSKRKSSIKFWKHTDTYHCLYKGDIGFSVSDVYTDSDIPPWLTECVCFEEINHEN